MRTERQLRAVRLIEQWIAPGSGDVGPETADLAEFLMREDRVLSPHLTEVVASAPELSVRAAAAWEQKLIDEVATGRYVRRAQEEVRR